MYITCDCNPITPSVNWSLYEQRIEKFYGYKTKRKFIFQFSILKGLIPIKEGRKCSSIPVRIEYKDINNRINIYSVISDSS